MNAIQVSSLDKTIEKILFKYMNKDRILNFWGIYDLTYERDKNRAWVALRDSDVVGYLINHNERVLHIRGRTDCVIPLLKNSELATPVFNIEKAHVHVVRSLFKPTEPTDATTKGKVTTYLAMKANQGSFKPIISHPSEEVGREKSREVSSFLVRDLNRTEDLLKGLAFGLYENGRLISFAAAPEVLEDLAIIRGVYTSPDSRGKGYATSVCSALVAKVLEDGKEPILYVSKDNEPAIHVYKKLGFKETGHLFASFKAEKR